MSGGWLAAWSQVLTVLRKELIDALRDRRTLLTVLVSSVLVGPVMVVALSGLVGSLEQRAERRQVYAVGLEAAPGLRNFIERQSYDVKPPPADYETLLKAGRLHDAVLVIPSDFESKMIAGDQPAATIVSDSANRDASVGAGRVRQLLEGYLRERATLSVALRGVSPQVLAPFDIDDVDLASAASRATQFTGILPFFVLMAVLYGALNAALDSTAGERERGSLEPLLMTPAERGALVLGKWGAVASLGMLVALLSCLSFLPAQSLLRSDTLAAMFRFGWREAALFLAVLAPLAASTSALMMAIAIRCRTFKEAQASTTVVVLATSLLPMVNVFDPGDARWHLWVPGLAQSALMTRVLKGEALGPEQIGVPLLVCAALAALALTYVVRSLRSAALSG